MADTSNHQGVRGIATIANDPRRGEQRALAARGAMCVLMLGVLALVLQSAATATPMWGYYMNNPDSGNVLEHGYFGPWEVCRITLHREKCGPNISKFQPVGTVWVAGIVATIASASLAILVVLAILQLAMASSAKRVVISYSTAVMGKVAMGTLATCLAIVTVSLFVLQTDQANSYTISRGEAFYMQLAAIVLNFSVLVSCIYEGIYTRRSGDPTKVREISDVRSTTINNPGYREHRRPTNGGSISMTDASGKPYGGAAGNGSMASVTTSGSVGSTASPLRSSLKKPKPLGIQNPGFSTHSPTLSRNGSQKKVRIQTHSTEV